MKSMKKSLAFLVVLTMILSTVAPVFAATTPADVAGTDYESAVGNLSVLGIVSGDKETGNYRPNDNITRAEFARIACSALGLDTAAEIAKGPTKFKDVSASHWASGYINVAAEKGIIKGYPGSIFKPDENVTYGEAITILVRALGMGDYVDKIGGTWPANYLAAGSTAGITSGIAGLTGDGKAIRGTIAQLTWNTLGAEVWGAKEYTSTGITYGPLDDKTLLSQQFKDYVFKNSDDKYVTKYFTNVKVTGTQVAGGLDADQIKVSLDDQSDLADMLDVSSAAYKVVDVTATGVDLNSLFGKKVDLFFGKDNKVVNIKVSTSASDIVEGYIDDYYTADQKIDVKATPDATTVKKYGFTTDASIYVNTKEFTKAEFFSTVYNAIKNSTAKVSMVLDGGAIDTLNVFVADADAIPGLTTKQFVVAEITSANKVKNVAESRSEEFDLDDLSDVNDYYIVKNGKVATKDDIKVGDAVTYVDNNDFIYIVDTDNKVTGKITKNSSDDNAFGGEARRKLTVNSVAYAMPYDAACAYSKSNSTDEEDVENTINDMSDFYNKDATLTLNALGEILFVSGSVSSSSADMQVGVISRAPATSGDDYTVKILGQDGVVKSYTIKSGKIEDAADKSGDVAGHVIYGDNAVTAADFESVPSANEIELDDCYTDLAAGTPVMFEVSADNKIDAEDFYTIPVNANLYYGDLHVKDTLGAVTTVVDTTKKINTASATYLAKSTTTYLNAYAGTIEKIGGWDALVQDDLTTNLNNAQTFQLFVYDDDNVLKSIILDLDTTSDPYLDSDYSYGVYMDEETNSDDTLVTLLVNGASKQYTVNGSIYSGLDKGDLVEFKVNGDGDYDNDTGVCDISYIQDLVDDDSVNADVYKIDSWDSTDKIITFKTAAVRASGHSEKVVNLASDVVVYDCTGTEPKVGALSDISTGKYVFVYDYDTDDDDYAVVVIVD